jgi:hypothetical protein
VDVTQQGPLARWVAAVLDEFGLAVDADRMTRVVLDLARDVAHAVDRPAAPVTAYLLGIVAGRAAAEPDAGLEQVTEQAAARVRRLLQGWSPAE